MYKMTTVTLSIFCVIAIASQTAHAMSGFDAIINDPQPANGSSKPTPVYTVDLNLPAEDRWTHIVTPYRPQILKILNFMKKIAPEGAFEAVTAILGDIEGAFGQPWADEMRGVAKALNISLGDVVYTNLYYEFDAACTSIVAQQTNGTIYHGRNMDYGLPNLQAVTIQVNFKYGDGPVLYTATTYASFVGVLTGIRNGAFSVSINKRQTNASMWENLIDALKGYHVIGFTLRTALQNEPSFDDAVLYLRQVKLITVSYLIVAGTKANQGVVITRERDHAIDVWRLNAPNRWFLVETNYDHWRPVPSNDDRRDPANQHMNKTDPNTFNASTMWSIMTMYPNLNNVTIYTTVMVPSTGQYLSETQNNQQ